jgi:hypothetical protein
VRIEDGKTVYNWSKIDQLCDDLRARHIEPFVELGFTPKALARSENSIFRARSRTAIFMGSTERQAKAGICSSRARSRKTAPS